MYRIKVDYNKKFINYIGGKGITCGIHYDALHLNPIYNNFSNKSSFPISEKESIQTVSIPFHENLDKNGQLDYVIKCIKKYE